MNEKANRNKLLAAVLAMALIAVCGIVVLSDSPVYAEESEATQEIGYTAGETTATVYSAEQLRTVLADAEGTYSTVTTIIIGGPFTVDHVITVNKDVTIDGNGQTITAIESATFTGDFDTAPKDDSKYVLGIVGATATVQDLTIENAGFAFGFNVWGGTVTIDSVASNNSAGAGFVIGNNATVTLNNVSATGYVWGGVNADKGATVKIDSIDNVGSIYTENTTGTTTITDLEDQPLKSNVVIGLGTSGNAGYFNGYYVDIDEAAAAYTKNVEDKTAEININADVTLDVDLTVGANTTMTVAKDITLTNNADITINGTATGTINNSADASTTLGTSSTITGLALNGGNVIDDRENATIFADMEDGETFTYGGVTYTIYKFEFQNKSYQYGVYLDTITYKNSVSIEDLKASWEPFPTSDELSMKFNDNVAISWLVDGNKEYGNYEPTSTFTPGAIIISGTTTVKSGQTPAFNKILDLVLQPIQPTVSIEVTGWDIKEGPASDCVKVTYTYTDVDGVTHTLESVEAIEALENGLNVNIWLSDGTTTYAYEDWDTIQFTEGQKTFTAYITVPSWNNGIYAEASDNDGFSVTLRNLTDQDSLLTFAPYEGETAYGVSPDRLQTEVTLPEVTIDDITAHAYSGAITASVYYYNGAWDGAVWPADQDEGYYLVFNVNTANKDVLWSNAYLKVTGPAGIEKTYDSKNVFDGYFMLYLGNDAEKLAGLTLTMVYDQDGLEQDWYTSTTYNITLTFTTLDWKYSGIIFYDTANSSWAGNDYYYVYDNAQGFFTPGDDIVLPSVASEDGPNGWYSQATNEYFQAGSIFIILDKYANADGQIILEARYDAPVTEVTTHTVTFVVDENTSYSVTVIDGQSVAQPFAPYVEGMAFVGWNNGDVAYDFTAAVTGDLELTAQFAPVTVEYSADVVVGFLKGEDGLTVTFTAKDGKEIPAGALIISYMYLTYNEALGMIMPASGSYTYEGGIAAGTTFVDIPAEDIAGYEYMTQMTVTFETEGGSFENFGPLSAAIPEVPTA